MRDVTKIGVIVPVSQELLDQMKQSRKDWEFYLSHRKEIKAQNAASATYWPNHEAFDNPCVQRGGQDG